MVRKLGLLALLLAAPGVLAGPLVDAVRQLDFQQLQQTFDAAKVDRLLNGYGHNLNDPERRAAAVLISARVLNPEDLRNREKMAQKLLHYRQVLESDHPALVGRLGDATLPMRLAQGWSRSVFPHDERFFDALTERLSTGVMTGYDVRRKGVYAGFPGGFTFVYSQSSALHLQQLATLLASEGMEGWVYVTPKVSAFLYRDDWGPASDNVRTLSNGERVVEGREVAAMFQFDSADDRYRFHELITRYAEKDTKDEKGLIADAWWQPFYYTDTAMEDFKPISLIVITSGNHEATLTVPERKAPAVSEAFSDGPWQVRVDRVWVNPAFYRFLHGGYK